MYVCVCNAIKSSEIEALARDGVRDAAEVYSALKVETNCESCVEFVQETLDECRIDAQAKQLHAADTAA